MNFFNTFRGRLLLILALLLIATIAVQFYLNYLTQQESIYLRDTQARALVAGIVLGTAGLTAREERVTDLIDRPGQTYLDEVTRPRILDVIIIDNQWRVSDSLAPDRWPTRNDNGGLSYRMLWELDDLPPLMEARRLGEDLKYFPNTSPPEDSNDEAHAVPIDTSEGRWYVMVLLRNDRSEAAWRAARPLLVTLAVLMISTLITFWLVWRFTRPIANLSAAARRVAEGDLTVRVPDEDRGDEMGRLAQRFNEMTAELEKTKELEAQLRLAEQSAVVGRLGSAIAHEIRNPLNYINLTLDHLRSKYAPEDPESKANFVNLTSQLKAEVARINQQIGDFLNYSRPAKADLRPVDSRQVVEDSLRLIECQAEENDIKISVIENENAPKVLGDPDYLRSVFNNIFINAVQAIGSSGGRLNIKIAPDNGWVRFEIADSGIGISEDDLSKIFEPYYSTKDTGTGLGLAIVQKVVDMHGGAIDVESAKGKGTTFTIRLPKAEV
ncbi:MAG TPA: HAMP domain-containing sensor histidine kinase [Pyrinomonadaceae bacterium]|nr:HAMP domain-containing sensor histidine kinase [Pyrinomonadaceae bacterium]